MTVVLNMILALGAHGMVLIEHGPSVQILVQLNRAAQVDVLAPSGKMC